DARRMVSESGSPSPRPTAAIVATPVPFGAGMRVTFSSFADAPTASSCVSTSADLSPSADEATSSRSSPSSTATSRQSAPRSATAASPPATTSTRVPVAGSRCPRTVELGVAKPLVRESVMRALLFRFKTDRGTGAVAKQPADPGESPPPYRRTTVGRRGFATRETARVYDVRYGSHDFRHRPQRGPALRRGARPHPGQARIRPALHRPHGPHRLERRPWLAFRARRGVRP